MPPVDITLGAAAQLALGSAFSCGLLVDNSVKCWGSNVFGQLGVGSTSSWYTPGAAVNLGTSVPVSITAGSIHVCILSAAGAGVCWGGNSVGQLGIGSTQSVGCGGGCGAMPPGAANLGGIVVQITAGDRQTCAILSGGVLVCVGYGFYGSLGTGNSQNSGDMAGRLPTSVPLTQFGWLQYPVSVSVGGGGSDGTACTLLQLGDLTCWGYNYNGQLGIGNTGSIGDDVGELPSALVSLGTSKVHSVMHGASHVCALMTDGDVKCWGGSSSGQLGLGNTLSVGDNAGEMPPPLVSLNPFLSTVLPGSISSGSVVTLLGVGFGSLAQNVTVFFNSTPCSLVKFSSLHVECSLAVSPGQYFVSVARFPNRVSNSLQINVLASTPTRTRTRQTRTRTRTRTTRPQPVITTVYPPIGKIGDLITLTGSQFGTSSSVLATVGGVSCQNLTRNGVGTIIICAIPEIGTGIQSIFVTRDGIPSNFVGVTVVENLVLRSIYPSEGITGTVVNISSAVGDFGGTRAVGASDILVTVGGVQGVAAQILQYNFSWMTARMPAGVASLTPVSVFVKFAVQNWASSNFLGFTYISPPVLLQLTPPNIVAGGILSVMGSNFGTDANSLLVVVGGFPCNSLVLVSGTLLTCNVASSLPVGPANVTVTRFTTSSDPVVVRIVSECAALAQWYAAGGNWWISSSGWGSADPCCTWFGVSCSNQLNIDAINMPSNNITGVMPNNLSDLYYLETLNLTRNGLNGGVDAVCGLTRLATLDVSSNAVTTLPSCVGNLQSLVHLDMSWNLIQGVVPIGLSTLPNLSRLLLRNNFFQGNLPSGGFNSLVVIDVRRNRLYGSLPSIGVSSLRVAHLGANRFSGVLAPYMCPPLLQEWTFGCNFFSSVCSQTTFLNVSVDCANPDSAFDTDKNTCQQDGEYLDVSASTCVSSCNLYVPVRVGPFATQCRSNTSCTTGCSLCNGPGLALASDSCVLCDEFLGFAVSLNGTICTSSCGQNQIVSTQSQVDRCQCDYASGWFPNSDNSECRSCPNRNEFFDVDSCKPCHEDCVTCIGGSSGDCLSCRFGVEFRSFGGACSGSCSSCLSSFVRRPNAAFADCVCPPGTSLQAGSCVSCAANTYSAQYGINNECVPCDSYRGTSGLGNRTTAADCVCKPTFEEQPSGACLCPAGSFYDSSSGTCLSCAVDSYTATPNLGTSCNSCGSLGAFRTTRGVASANSTSACVCPLTMIENPSGSDCVCPLGTYFSETTKSCSLCPVDTFQDILGRSDHCTSCALVGSHRTTVGFSGRTSSRDCVCPPSMIVDPATSRCVCAAGYFFDPLLTLCTPCPIDTFSADFSTVLSCAACSLVGDYRTSRLPGGNSSASCVCFDTMTEDPTTRQCLCAPGSFYNPATKRCITCPADTFQDAASISLSCQPCSSNRITFNHVGRTDASQCLCQPGFFPDSDRANCLNCVRLKEKATCLGASELNSSNSTVASAGVSVSVGYWLTTDLQFRKTPQAKSSNDWFVVVKCPVRSGCPGGLQEEACAVGYQGPACGICANGFGRLGQECAQCPTASVSAFLVFLVIVLVVAGCAFIVYFSNPEKISEIFDDSNTSQRLKIAITHLQIIGFSGNFASQWPEILTRVFAVPASAATISSATDNIATDCATNPSIYTRAAVVVVLPLILCAGVALGYGLVSLRHGFSGIGRKIAHGTLTLLYVAHPGIVQGVLKIMVCVDVGSESFAKSDMSVNCQDSGFIGLRVFGAMYLVIYGLGGLVLLFFGMKRDPSAFLFLTRGYKPELFFWDLVVTFRKIVFVVVSLFASAPLQLFFGTWILLLSWLGQHFFAPYESSLLGKMEQSSLWVLLITVTTGMLFYTGVLHSEAGDGFAVSILLILLNFATIVVFVFLAARKGLRKQQQATEMRTI
eukprot:TRINITY_DN322_c0_g1_i1.p1 TRINITY_DN322_c0_g1~~TRINITY_DN322_c0_g1_i1.p1  ORF type:complete len:2118 (-),score=348.64 TRINITY_DN322_c0_g1_i1:14-5707(-)